MKLDLCAKYAPTSLKDVYLQKPTVAYLKAVVNRASEAPKNYCLFGPWGCGKTASVRAFARDLLKVHSLKNIPNYIEIDSSENQLAQDFDSLRSFLFSQVPGYKVVLFDESHLLSKELQQKLLKPLEDNSSDIFFFFATTDPQEMAPTLISRCSSGLFYLHPYTTTQLVAYGRKICESEGHVFSDKSLIIAAQNAAGHVRDLLKQLEIIMFQGESYFQETYASLWSSLDKFFFSSASKDEVVGGLTQYPLFQVQSFLRSYMFNSLVKDNERSKKFFKPMAVPKIFSFYLKMSSYISDSDDFYSFLYIFHDFLQGAKINA